MTYRWKYRITDLSLNQLHPKLLHGCQILIKIVGEELRQLINHHILEGNSIVTITKLIIVKLVERLQERRYKFGDWEIRDLFKPRDVFWYVYANFIIRIEHRWNFEQCCQASIFTKAAQRYSHWSSICNDLVQILIAFEFFPYYLYRSFIEQFQVALLSVQADKWNFYINILWFQIDNTLFLFYLFKSNIDLIMQLEIELLHQTTAMLFKF